MSIYYKEKKDFSQVFDIKLYSEPRDFEALRDQSSAVASVDFSLTTLTR